MIVTIYKCDRCGAEQGSREQFWTVGVSASCSLALPPHEPYKKQIQVCRPCLDVLGIFVKEGATDDSVRHVPSVEELIREIIERCSE